jgi:hypothetical protein
MARRACDFRSVLGVGVRSLDAQRRAGRRRIGADRLGRHPRPDAIPRALADRGAPPLVRRRRAPHPSSAQEIAKLPPDGGPEFNRLIFEKSPYLQQHAANPVDWHPWGEAAFALAKAQGKMIFLSVGYSTCHWCHVMERESFEDEAVAALLNESFIPIKLDREERPDVDRVYMDILTGLMGQRGGWPMTIFMTSDGKPFTGGTYFPKEDGLGRRGMMSILPELARLWRDERERIAVSGDEVVRAATELGALSAPGEVTAEVLDRAYDEFSMRFDEDKGGFSNGPARAPKFPSPHDLTFLLRQHKRTGDARALEMVEKTLDEMRRGGIFDHVGFGFHRYSTDADWLVPHFEKMLYDQATLIMAYAEAYQIAGKPEYADTVRRVASYVGRDLTSPEGGFYSAEDADSEGEEGKFYLWTVEEVNDSIGFVDGGLFMEVYGFEPDGNFIDPVTGEKIGKNIPHLKAPYAQHLAEKRPNMSEHELNSRMDFALQRLFETRRARVRPPKDDKILTDWNGLMVAALAKAGMALDEPRMVEAARRGADFILTRMMRDDGRLHHRYRQGEVGLEGGLDDYAFAVWGLLEVYEATFHFAYFERALKINEAMIRHFWDAERGGFYMTPDDGEDLLVRPRAVYDGAVPSGNSVAAMNLLRIGRIVADPAMERRARDLMTGFGASVLRSPSSHSQLLQALDFAVGPSHEIVIAGDYGSEGLNAMARALRRAFLPNKVLIYRPTDINNPPINVVAKYTVGQVAIDGKATAYVCQNYACDAPTTDIAVMLRSLGLTPP